MKTKDIFSKIAERDACTTASKFRRVKRYQFHVNGRWSRRLLTGARANRAIRLAKHLGFDAWKSHLTVIE
jgi:hypothetical protein